MALVKRGEKGTVASYAPSGFGGWISPNNKNVIGGKGKGKGTKMDCFAGVSEAPSDTAASSPFATRQSESLTAGSPEHGLVESLFGSVRKAEALDGGTAGGGASSSSLNKIERGGGAKPEDRAAHDMEAAHQRVDQQEELPINLYKRIKDWKSPQLEQALKEENAGNVEALKKSRKDLNELRAHYMYHKLKLWNHNHATKALLHLLAQAEDQDKQQDKQLMLLIYEGPADRIAEIEQKAEKNEKEAKALRSVFLHLARLVRLSDFGPPAAACPEPVVNLHPSSSSTAAQGSLIAPPTGKGGKAGNEDEQAGKGGKVGGKNAGGALADADGWLLVGMKAGNNAADSLLANMPYSGVLSSTSRHGHGFIKCLDFPNEHVFVHKSVLATCQLKQQDEVRFRVHINSSGMPQLSAPCWRKLADGELSHQEMGGAITRAANAGATAPEPKPFLNGGSGGAGGGAAGKNKTGAHKGGTGLFGGKGGTMRAQNKGTGGAWGRPGPY